MVVQRTTTNGYNRAQSGTSFQAHPITNTVFVISHPFFATFVSHMPKDIGAAFSIEIPQLVVDMLFVV